MARERFVGTLPAGLLYHPAHHMWVREAGDHIVIGATSFGAWLAGEIIAFMPKPVGAETQAGRGLGIVETGKTVLSVHSPAALVIIEGNEMAQMHPELINRDPYGEGWMLRARATDWAADKVQLVGAAEYRELCLAEDPDAGIEIEG